MRRRALLVGLITGLAALAVCSQIAGAQAVERIRISDPARQGHELPPGLLVELASPAEYNRQSVSGESGRWVGPRYEERGNPGNAGLASLELERQLRPARRRRRGHRARERGPQGLGARPARGPLRDPLRRRSQRGHDPRRLRDVHACRRRTTHGSRASSRSRSARTCTRSSASRRSSRRPTRSWSRAPSSGSPGTGARCCSP